MLSVCVPVCGPERVLIFGATGKSGKKVMREAVKAGANVTVYVRNPARIPPELKDKVTIKQGNIFAGRDYKRISKSVSELVANVAPTSIIITSALERNASFAPLNTNLVPVIIGALTYAGRLSSCKIIYLSGVFSTEAPGKGKPSAPLSCSLSCMASCFGVEAMVKDNNNVGNFLIYDADPSTQFVIVKMGYVSDAKSKGTLVPVLGKDAGQTVTFEDMGKFLVDLAMNYKPELNRKIVFAKYN
jgi:hypothetical protein